MPLFTSYGAGSSRSFGLSALSIVPPLAPTSFSATGVAQESGSGLVTISFAPPAGPVTSYQVENTSTGQTYTITGSGQTVPSAVNNTYSFRVRGVNSAGPGAWTSTDTAGAYYRSNNNDWYNQDFNYTVPASTTINYRLYSGGGSGSKPDTRQYGYVTRWNGNCWFDNYGTGCGANWQSGYYHPYPGGPFVFSGQTARDYSGSYWWGYDPNWTYLDGNYSYAGFSNTSTDGYYYIYANGASSYWGWSAGANIGGWYQTSYSSYEAISGSPGFSFDYSEVTYIYNVNGSQQAATGQGSYNNRSTTSGSFVSSGAGNIRIRMGSVNYYYGYEPGYHYPFSSGSVWWGV